MFKFKKNESNSSYEKVKRIVLNVIVFFLLTILGLRILLPYCVPTKHKIENITTKNGIRFREHRLCLINFAILCRNVLGFNHDRTTTVLY